MDSIKQRYGATTSMSINLNNLLEQQIETEHKEKDPLSSQKNEDVIATEEATGESGEHEEKSPATSTNLSSVDNQQFEKHEEKLSLTTDNNSSPSTTDLNSGSAPKKLEVKFTPDYEANEPVFWCVFKELANENNGLVSYDKLQERLIATGKFYAGESILMIEYMEEMGKIEQTEHYHVYRTGKPVPTKKEEWDNMR
jgi:hypothetical protein